MASKADLEKRKNEDALKLAISKVNARLDKIHLGGGEKRMEKHRKKGKMTARERVDALIDCLLYTSPSPRDQRGSRMPSSA